MSSKLVQRLAHISNKNALKDMMDSSYELRLCYLYRILIFIVANLQTTKQKDSKNTIIPAAINAIKSKIALAVLWIQTEPCLICIFHNKDDWKLTPRYLKSLICFIIMMLIITLWLQFACHLKKILLLFRADDQFFLITICSKSRNFPV